MPAVLLNQRHKGFLFSQKMETTEQPNYTARQQIFIDSVIAGKNIFLTGDAGTGKSFIVKEAQKLLTKADRKYIAVAPTGIAASNIDGATLHSTFALDPFHVLTYELCSFVKSGKRKMLQMVQTIIIDEVSMLRPDILDAIHWTLIKNGCKGLDELQIIFVGDLEQLPAVVDDNMMSVLLGTYSDVEFFNAKIYPALNVETIELNEVMRQSDIDFISALNMVRKGVKSEYFKQFIHKEPHGVILAATNAIVSLYNHRGLVALEGEEIVYNATISGKAKATDFNFESQIKVKEGAKIMYLINSKENPLRNGTIGTFTLKDDVPFIVVNGLSYKIVRTEITKKEYRLNDAGTAFELVEIGSMMQMPFRLAYALTIHKSQGLTFDEVTLDLTVPCFSKGQHYVALSRVRTPGGLRIIVKNKVL